MKSMSKKVQDIMCQVEDDIMYRLKDELAPGLAAYVKDMAQKTVQMLLEGNEKMMREYLSCKSGGWTGRSTDRSFRPIQCHGSSSIATRSLIWCVCQPPR